MSELEQSGHGRGVDVEAGGDLPSGALAVVDGVEDAFAEVVRQGLDESPPPFERSVLQTVCHAGVNRCKRVLDGPHPPVNRIRQWRIPSLSTQSLLSPAWPTKRILQADRDLGMADERGQEVSSLAQ